MVRTKKQQVIRIVIYLLAITMLGFGTILITRADLGIPCITSVPAAISKVTGGNLSVMVFAIYVCMIGAQFIMKGKDRSVRDFLQLAVSVIFSFYLELFERLVQVHFDQLWQNALMLMFGVFIIGVGVCMMVNMEISPTPPDGLVYAISKKTGKDMGLIKNILDISFVATAVMIDLISSGKVTTVGIGTVYSMIFLGRTIYVVNRFFKRKMRVLAGMEA